MAKTLISLYQQFLFRNENIVQFRIVLFDTLFKKNCSKFGVFNFVLFTSCFGCLVCHFERPDTLLPQFALNYHLNASWLLYCSAFKNFTICVNVRWMSQAHMTNTVLVVSITAINEILWIYAIVNLILNVFIWVFVFIYKRFEHDRLIIIFRYAMNYFWNYFVCWFKKNKFHNENFSTYIRHIRMLIQHTYVSDSCYIWKH